MAETWGNSEDLKLCKKCMRILPLEDFSTIRRPPHLMPSPRSYCKACENKRVAAYRQANREIERQRQRQYHASLSEEQKQYMRARRNLRHKERMATDPGYLEYKRIKSAAAYYARKADPQKYQNMLAVGRAAYRRRKQKRLADQASDD